MPGTVTLLPTKSVSGTRDDFLLLLLLPSCVGERLQEERGVLVFDEGEKRADVSVSERSSADDVDKCVASLGK